jgi:soluble lytic murein transglycosylase-like protein
MRTIVVVVILLLGISSAVAEPELCPMAPGSLQVGGAESFWSSLGTASAIAAGNREPVAVLPPVQTIEPSPVLATISSDQSAPSGQAASAKGTIPSSAPIATSAQAASAPPESLDTVCGTLLTSAHDNDLPITFFANLIWQESRLRDNALSPKGAMGIAQFMPKVAAQSGVQNPFDPSQALPASAKLLRELFDQFGNLGYVAAAYNAGSQRVLDWLERGRSLPRETRDYVMDITGRSVEAWRKKPENGADLRFAGQLPCRQLPAFAELEQSQTQQPALQHKQAEEAYAQVTPSQQETPPQETAATQPQEVAKTAPTAQREKRARLAEDVHPTKPIRHEVVRIAERERPRLERESRARTPHMLSEEHRRA